VGVNGTVYSGSDDRTIRAWSGEDGTLLRTLHGHTYEVNSLGVGADGTLFSTDSHGKHVRVWCGVTGALRSAIFSSTIGDALAMAPDGKLYTWSRTMGGIAVW
jgi:WD40 repeat protein